MKGFYVTTEAVGAEKNGTRMEKVNSVSDDGHKDGDLCTVLGSAVADGKIAYFVEWDDMKGVAIGILGTRLRKAGV